MASEAANIEARQEAMRLCALAEPSELAALVSQLAANETVSDLRRPERGLVMLQGRTGGEGAPFNLGEASVVRAAVALSCGTTGFAYHLGRDTGKARAAATLDALRQRPGGAETIDEALRPIAERIAAEDRLHAERTAATRVEFFTMTRGED